jgi:hypothetical protein
MEKSFAVDGPAFAACQAGEAAMKKNLKVAVA